MADDTLYLNRSEVRQVLLRHHLAGPLRDVDALPIYTAEDVERGAIPGRPDALSAGLDAALQDEIDNPPASLMKGSRS